MIHQVGRGLGHAPGVARRADAAPLADEGDQKVVPARRATSGSMSRKGNCWDNAVTGT